MVNVNAFAVPLLSRFSREYSNTSIVEGAGLWFVFTKSDKTLRSRGIKTVLKFLGEFVECTYGFVGGGVGNVVGSCVVGCDVGSGVVGCDVAGS